MLPIVNQEEQLTLQHTEWKITKPYESCIAHLEMQ